MRKRTLTRAELHQLVWSEPLRALSVRFGVTDVAILEACVMANVPVPEDDHRRRHGPGADSRAVLPMRSPGMSETVRLGSPTDRRRALADILETTGIPAYMERIAAVRERVSRQIGPLPVGWDPGAKLASRRFALLADLFAMVARTGARGRFHGRENIEILIEVHAQRVCLRLDPIAPTSGSGGEDGTPAARRGLRLSIVDPLDTANVRIAWQDGEGDPLETRIREIAVEVITTAEIQRREGELQLRAWGAERQARFREDRRADAEDVGRGRPIRSYVETVGSKVRAVAEPWRGRTVPDESGAISTWDGEGGAL